MPESILLGQRRTWVFVKCSHVPPSTYFESSASTKYARVAIEQRGRIAECVVNYVDRVALVLVHVRRQQRYQLG
jgi:hypothetical protein